jgi:hypothetical protein
MKSYTLDVKFREDGEAYIELPDELIDEAGWEVGDDLEWSDNGDGSFTLTKSDKEWVLVECVSSFRQRYMVQVPKGKAEWALDTVVCEEAKEFSQEHIGEQIVSHRVISYDEALKLCDKDNDYTKSWDEELKVKTFFTKEGEKREY